MEQRTKQPRHAGVRDTRWRTNAHIFRQGTRPSREETRAPQVFPNAALSGRKGRETPRIPASMLHDVLAEEVKISADKKRPVEAERRKADAKAHTGEIQGPDAVARALSNLQRK